MAKTLQDYLGESATLEQGRLSVSVTELYGIIFPEKQSPYELTVTQDSAIACLLGALNVTARPQKESTGIEIQDAEQGITSSESFQSKTFETRQDVSQVKHEFIFNVYIADTTGFDPAKVV